MENRNRATQHLKFRRISWLIIDTSNAADRLQDSLADQAAGITVEPRAIAAHLTAAATVVIDLPNDASTMAEDDFNKY